MILRQLATCIGGKPLNICAAALSATVNKLAIDGRLVLPGDVFVALPGARADGHFFINQAIKNGAAAAIVCRPQAGDAPQIAVDDCAAAMLTAAKSWRRQFNGAMTTITGSNGKTTVKEMLAAILCAAGGEESVLKSDGNFNNHLGLPITLSGLRAGHRFAVVELGMDAAGELTTLGKIAKPDVAVITNVGRAHLGGFASLSKIAAAKGEVLSTLSGDGVAVLNGDDDYFPLWKEMCGARKIFSFAMTAMANCRGRSTADGLFINHFSRAIKLQVAGAHNRMNALAAAAAAAVLNINETFIIDGLQSFAGVARRLQIKKLPGGGTLIDDTYNANPESVAAALAVLQTLPGKKIAVLGDMSALGEGAAAEHQKVVNSVGDDIILLTVGEHFAAVKNRGQHFRGKNELVAALKKMINKESRVLIKGSRAMKMEDAAAALEAE